MTSLLSAGGRPRETVPLFPLATVLFPGARLPLRIFEPRYMDMAKACLKQGTPFGVCLIKEGKEVGAPAVPEGVGCLATLGDWDMEQLGILKVNANGLDRFRILGSVATDSGLVVGDIERFAPEPQVDVPELAQSSAFVRKVIEAVGPSRFNEPYRYDDASWVGFRLSEILPLRNVVKQKLLELTDAGARLAILHRFLREQRLLV
jgi:Lon protease-like protein